MSYKSLMVQVDAAEAANPILALATALAARFGARLIGVGAGALLPPVTDPTAGAIAVAGMIEAEEGVVRDALEQAAARFRAAAGGLAAEWRGFLDQPAEALAREARAADLVILPRGGAAGGATGGATPMTDPADLVQQLGRPLLVVPPGVRELSAKRVVLAWHDAPETRRAAAAALPFLKDAESVLVAEVTESSEAAEAARARLADVVSWLGTHGARAEAAVLPQSGSVAATLQQAAAARGADLLVAGAYGQSRLAEWMFGGNTRALLTDCPICCLLSH